MLLPYHVYILLLSNGQTYVGCTSDLNKRLLKHKNGEVKFTSDKLPAKCICTVGFVDKHLAYAFEKYLKSGSGRAFMRKRLVGEL